jgi:hypothetical protein
MSLFETMAEATKPIKYQILIYKDKNWTEIPQKDNPAFNKSLFFKEGRPDWYAIIICKVLPYEAGVTGKDGYVVTDVSVNVSDVLRLGVFWTLENATTFANAYAAKCELNPKVK